MFIASKDISSPIKAQVAVVGAGPAGMALSLDLARRGVDVALLSSAGLGSHKMSEDLYRETTLSTGQGYGIANEARSFGGLSWAWGGRCVPMDPIDFEPRPELDLPGWPIGPADLEKFAADAADFLCIGHPEFDDGRIFKLNGLAIRLERWAATPLLAKRHRHAFAKATGPRTFLDLRCIGGEINANGRIMALHTMRSDRSFVRVEASEYVLAMGGLETARLLLWLFESNGRKAPLWTGRGYMGHLRGSILALAGTRDTIAPLDYHRDQYCYLRRRIHFDRDTLNSMHFPNIGFWLDNREMADPAHGSSGLSLAYIALSTPVLGELLMANSMRAYFIGHEERRYANHLWNIMKNPLEAVSFCLSSWFARRRVPVLPGRIAWPKDGQLPLTFSAEERPVFANGVELSEELDRFQVPKPKITREPHRDDLLGAIKANLKLAERLQSSGFADVRVRGDLETQFASIAQTSRDDCHQIGTARMGTGRADAVTDKNGKVFGLDNLFINGSALFPRSGQANPTYTIVCLSLRLAQYISNKFYKI